MTTSEALKSLSELSLFRFIQRYSAEMDWEIQNYIQRIFCSNMGIHFLSIRRPRKNQIKHFTFCFMHLYYKISLLGTCFSLPSSPLSERRRYCVAWRHAICLCVHRPVSAVLHAALVSAAKVMRCIQCCLAIILSYLSMNEVISLA